MDKQEVVSQIKEYLEEELKEADQERSAEIQGLLLMYRFLPTRKYTSEDVIIPSALVELQLGNTHAYYFVAPQGGGLVTRVQGQAVQVITPQSPLGEALLGKKVGDQINVRVRDSVREYKIVSIS